MVIVPHLFPVLVEKGLCQVDFHAMDELDAYLIAVELFGHPAHGLSVLGESDGLLPVLYGGINVLLEVGTAVKEAVVRVEMVSGVVGTHRTTLLSW